MRIIILNVLCMQADSFLMLASYHSSHITVKYYMYIKEDFSIFVFLS